jgi:SAM-dependent methyltransferase
MGSNNKEIFAQDDKFWDNYLKGRPRVPESLFIRLFDYHQAKGSPFGTVHDVGAGNGVYAKQLRSRFSHVIVSDIVPENIELARHRLHDNAEGFSFRAAALQDADNIPAGSVDMVFAANVMHFPEPQDKAMKAVAHQLRPGGTFFAAVFGPARFRDAELQDLWARVSNEGGRQLLKRAEDPEKTIRIMARTQDSYNVAPLDPALFAPGALRIHLNMGQGGVQGMLPPEEAHRNTEPNYSGDDDVDVHEDDEGWSFETDLAGVKEHFNSFPFISQFPDAFTALYQELGGMAHKAPFQGYFPVKIILATRR